MDAKQVAKYLTTLKEKSGLTFEAIAEKSQRSESTVKNLCSGKSEDPRIDTVAPIVYAMGGSLDEMFTGKKDAAKEISLSAIKEMYEFQLAEHRKTEEAHIANIRSHYEQHREDTIQNYEMRLADKREIIKEKDEHIATLKKEHSEQIKTQKKEKVVAFVCALACASVLVGILILEVMNPELGWIKF